MKCVKSVFSRIFVFMVAASVIFCGKISVSAAADGMYEYEVVDGGAVITKYLGAGLRTVTLPLTLGGYPVTGVGKEAFGSSANGGKPHTEITKVILHDKINFIGDRAFAGTSWIDSEQAADENGFVLVNQILIHYSGNGGDIVIPNGVKTINIAAFEKNNTITAVELPESVTEIGDYAFYRCGNLRRVVLGTGIKKIGRSAFYACGALDFFQSGDDQMSLPESLEEIGENAFYNCNSLRGIMTCQSKLRVCGTYAFAGCTALKGIRVPDTLENIGTYAFGFLIEVQDGVGYPKQIEKFTIYVTHKANEDPEIEKEILSKYNKAENPVYLYANNPDGEGFFPSFNLEWARLSFGYMLGDVNNDGKVTTVDARAVLRHIARLSPIPAEDLKAADVDKNGKVTSADARRILRAVARLEPIEQNETKIDTETVS